MILKGRVCRTLTSIVPLRIILLHQRGTELMGRDYDVCCRLQPDKR